METRAVEDRPINLWRARRRRGRPLGLGPILAAVAAMTAMAAMTARRRGRRTVDHSADDLVEAHRRDEHKWRREALGRAGRILRIGILLTTVIVTTDIYFRMAAPGQEQEQSSRPVDQQWFPTSSKT